MTSRAAVLFWVASAAATVVLLLPGDALPPTGEGLVAHIDKIEHALLFAALALLARRAFAAPAWSVLLALAVYGALIEVAQTQVPHRSADALDWVADVLGATAAFARVRPARPP